MIARTEVLSEEKRGWTKDSYWGDMVTRDFRACEDCIGYEGYTWDPEYPEVCTCEDGIDEEGRMMITKGCMRKMRRSSMGGVQKMKREFLEGMKYYQRTCRTEDS